MTHALRRFLCLIAAVACLASAGHSNSYAGDSPKEVEDRMTPQEAVDQLLVVDAKLNKPGENPEYLIGEPIIIELEIKNMSLNHNFEVPGWGVHVTKAPFDTWSSFNVTATRYKEPVPSTGMGRRSLLFLEGIVKHDPKWLAGYGTALRFEPDSKHLRVNENGITFQATPATINANLLCDLANIGDFELTVKFAAQAVLFAPGGKKGYALKTVSGKSLRLHITARQVGNPDLFYMPPANDKPRAK